MFDFLKPRHLRYHSMEEWREQERITSFRHPGNPALETRLRRQFEELRTHLWKRHLNRLSSGERKQIKQGTHPSQSHKRIDEAKAIYEEFRARLAGLPYVAEVTMVARQTDPVTLRVRLSQDVGWRVWQEHIPPFYRGFEVQVAVANNNRPALTRESAEKLIPNGMTERDVYARLGTNATVSLGTGHKYISYSFHLPPAPPRVEPKIDGIVVVLSNGVVVGRQFGGQNPTVKLEKS